VASQRRRLLGLIAVCALALLAPAAGTGADPAPRPPAVFTGLGTWIDIYSPSFRAEPAQVVAALAGRGVHTLFLETGNFRQRVDVVGPQRLAAFIEDAHARGIAVVGWYLPALTNPARDLRRARAAIGFRTSEGDRLDGFGLDIESSAVRDTAERTRRLLVLSQQLRADAGPEYPLGAIIPSPVGMKLLPRYWPRFPYAELARTYDALLPMAYFSYRARGRAAVARYVRTSIAIIRSATADATVSIHVIGGLADATDRGEAAAFVRAAATCGVHGLSLYDLDTTERSAWPLLRRAAGGMATAAPAFC
jgi:hypothetical protein